MSGAGTAASVGDPPAHRRLLRGIAATAAGQTFVAVTSGVQAVLIGAIFGTTPGTDGFFAAYGVYTLFVLLAQSWRTAIVARLAEAPSRFERFNRFCGATAVIFVVSGLIFVPLGATVASVFAGSLPPEAASTVRETLLLLWPAAGAQMVAALAAAMLGLLGDYTRAAIANSAGSATAIVGFLLLHRSMGVTALPVSILCGTFVTMVPLVEALVRAGWRPTAAIVTQLARNARAAGLLLFSSLTNALVYLVYLLSLAFASRLGTGVVTIYSYAYFVLGFATTFVSSSVMVVLAAPIAATWDRNARSLRPHMDDVIRTGLMIVIPVVAAGALIGNDVASALLTAFTPSSINDLLTVFFILSPVLVTSVAVTVPSVALFTLGRYRDRAVVALVVLLLHAAWSSLALITGSLAVLAAAAAASSIVGLVGVYWLLFGRDLVESLRWLVKQVLYVGAPAAACFVLTAVAFRQLAPSAFGDACALLVGLLLYGGWIATFMPHQRSLALRVAYSLRPSTETSR